MIRGDVPPSALVRARAFHLLIRCPKGGLESGCLFACVCMFCFFTLCTSVPMICAHMIKEGKNGTHERLENCKVFCVLPQGT